MQRRDRICRATVAIIGALWIFGEGAVFADTLAITYRSGKTQQVVLEEGAESIQDVRLQPAADAKDGGVRYHCAEEAAQPATAPKNEEQRTPEERKIKFRWGTPKVGE